MLDWIKDILKSDYGKAHAEIGETATISGQDAVPVIPSMDGVDQQTDDVGVNPITDVSLLIRLDDMDPDPAVDDLVTYRSRSYIISNIRNHPDGVFTVLYCRHLYE